ncbi:MAG: hypothetical protein AAFR45_06560 [Pseudomonadota bacterium]
MSTYLPKSVRDDLLAAQTLKPRRKNLLRAVADGQSIPVLRMWKRGFSVAENTAPALRGMVDLYDGSNHLYQCLIVASEAVGGEMRYEFKRSTAARTQPAADFVQDREMPAGLLTARSDPH